MEKGGVYVLVSRSKYVAGRFDREFARDQKKFLGFHLSELKGVLNVTEVQQRYLSTSIAIDVATDCLECPPKGISKLMEDQQVEVSTGTDENDTATLGSVNRPI